MPLAAKLVDELLATITDRSDKERGYLPFQRAFISPVLSWFS